ncbi:peptidase M23, partial [Flavobacteriaceae bacterium]|nr:peptidase M23 [Flavobacteriaceae bacterium]
MIRKQPYISFLLFLLVSITITAQQKSRKQLEKDRNRIKREIKMVNKLLFDTKKSEKNALEELKDLNQKITVREKYISTINKEVQSLSSEIVLYEKEIKELDKKLVALKKDYAAMIYK